MNKDKLIELREELKKMGKKRVGALGLAAMLAATPVVSLAEETKGDSQNSTSVEETANKQKVYDIDLGAFRPVSQERKSNPVTVEKYFMNVSQVSQYLLERLNAENDEKLKKLIQDIECLYFLSVCDFIPNDVENELVDGVNINGEVFNVIFNTDTSLNSSYSAENFDYAKELMHMIINYNDEKIKTTNNIDDLIDYTIFCYTESDYEIMKSIFMNWFNAHKNNTFNEESFVESFKELTNLNAEEHRYNVASMSVGARWIAQFGLGNNDMQFVRDYLASHYSRNDLKKYFVEKTLDEKIWILRDDFFLNLKCLNDLEYWVFTYGQLWKFCIEDVDKDITRIFQRSNVTVEEMGETPIKNQDVERNETSDEQEFYQIAVETYLQNAEMLTDYAKRSLNGSTSRKNLASQINCLYFVNNCVYLREIEEELINGIEVNGELIHPIFKTDMTKIADMSGIQNFVYANNFLNVRADFNQSSIRHTNNINKIIDLSEFCYNSHEKEYVHYLVELWFNSHKNNTYDFDSFYKLFSEIVAESPEAPINNVSVGVKWMIDTGIANDAMQVLRDYMLEHYTTKELCRFYRQDMLNMGQFYLKDNVNPKDGSPDILEQISYAFKELWRVCCTESCNEIFEYFGQSCKVKTK